MTSIPAILLASILAAASPQGIGEVHVAAKLSSPAAPVAAGASGKLSLELKIDKGWHIYSSDTVDGGLPTVVKPQFPEGFVIGEPVFPEPKEEEFFGSKMKAYEGTIQIEIPFTAPSNAKPGEIDATAKVTWQSCNTSKCLEGAADVSAKIKIVAGVAPAPPKSVAGKLIKSPEPGFDGQPYKMKVDMEIDNGEPAPGDTAVVSIHLDVETGNHTYAPDSDENGGIPLKFTSDDFEIVGKYEGPAPKVVHDPNLNIDQREYTGSVTLKQRVRVPAAGWKGKKPEFKVDGQVCDEKSCLPPASWTAAFDIKEKPAAAGTTGGAASKPAEKKAGGKNPASGDSPKEQSETLTLGAFAIASAFGGWASLFTPCVFPMIPITVSFFSKRAKGSRRRSIAMAGTYTLGIIGTFTLIGVGVSILFGASGLQIFAADKWVNMAMGTLFVVLGLALLGLFTISAPSSLTNKVEEARGNAKNDYAMTMLMAVAFTLASFTCTVPILGALLLQSTQDPWRATVGMLSYSSAFAAPFFLLAIFPTALQRLPKGGAWLEVVKISMGFAEIAAALKFFSTSDIAAHTELLTRPVFLAIWIALFLALALYLFGILKLPGAEGEVGPVRALFGTGVLAFVIYLMVGLFGGSYGTFLESFLPPADYGGARFSRSEKSGPKLRWLEDLKVAKLEAKQQNKRIFINFTGET